MKIFTVKSRQDFVKIQRNGEEIAGKNIILLYRPTDDRYIQKNTNIKNFVRFAFCVSKKIDKKAVIRNRIKRLFRSAVRKVDTKYFINFMDYEIIAKRKVVISDFNSIYSDLCECLGKIKNGK